MDSLGDRMKRYERPFQTRLIPRTPVIVRVDGRAFHTFCRKHKVYKPFDAVLMGCMNLASEAVAKQMQGFCAFYTQSDEASFLLSDFRRHESQGWFDYELQKVVSITASSFTAVFNRRFGAFGASDATFDARAFSIPEDDVINYFLWRAKDWERNSIQMYARAFFSHKELNGKNRADMHEMLHSKGKNWTTDLNDQERNGLFGRADRQKDEETRTVQSVFGYEKTSIPPSYKEIADFINPTLEREEEDE